MPSRGPPSTEGILYYTIPTFAFHSGTTLPNITIAYRSFGTPTSPRKILIPTCYGGRINTTLTFTNPTPNGPGALSSHHVIVTAMLGNGESSSPSNTPDFPTQLDYRDCVRAQHTLLTQHLGIGALEAVLGFSMGAQQAYYWACLYPTFLQSCIPICGSARTSPHNYAFLEGPKAALSHSCDYADGAYKAKGVKPVRGLRAFGRAYCAWAMSAPWFRARLWGDVPGGLGFGSLEEFMHAAWEKNFEEWDAEDLLVLARMWQAGDVGSLRADGDVEGALEEISARVLVMPCRTDQYFPPEDSEFEVSHLKNGRLVVLESIWGHIAGGGANAADTAWMDGQIAEFLK
ncbi:hypothetical protein MMC08_004838 [Hypocenomyce scalaris]|nr:hypothetical protein [Hypocenomyce scalaris]